MEENEKPRLSRLTAIITQLKSKQLVTATQLADKYNVSIRTIYRDIRTIENSGVPIVTVEGKGYSLMDGYTLPPLMFTEEEANALVTAEYLINQAKDTSLTNHFQAALIKIKSVFRSNIKEKSEILSDRMFSFSFTDEPKTSSSLSDLQMAITSKILTVIDYQKPEDETPISRTIEPVAIYYSKGNWILIAWCRLRNDYRAFRIDRMKKIDFHTAVFHNREFDLQEYFLRESQKYFDHP